MRKVDIQENSSDITTWTQKECSSKQSCKFKGPGEFLGDPCPGIQKSARIRYTCKTSALNVEN